ncbi:non-homologous end-joining DNA ligase [Agrobacterium tumefaciens]|uniref:DNA ligase (ATP) n=1 Tax=Agrobacterium tumefaciens TaxID=358 RepID=A0A176XAC5_AGRTU|nr:non-homologous end-joining DNA ligase [Agrobacterium tumefaciens]OAE45436.1 ATP-dependent DNA ligase [Agrobacterium tumefaciens]
MVKRPRNPPSAPLLNEDDASVRGGRRRPRNPSQPHLPFDPMPSRIEPCLAELMPRAPSGDRWAYEIKWDGYRIAVHKSGDQVTVITRGGHDWTKRFPAIAAAAKALPVGSCILDGEAVVLDEVGRSDYNALVSDLGGPTSGKAPVNSVLMAFDLLYFDGHSLLGVEQSSRRHLLESLVPADETGSIRLSQEIDGDGQAIFQAACSHELEGIIAKDKDAPYRSGRSGDWKKIKCIASDGFLILGYERRSGYGGIGKILMAAKDGDQLRYVGGVGTGLSSRSAATLKAEIEKVVVLKPAIPMSRKRDVVWVRPVLIAEVEYRGWTGDGKLRHASYKGLRDPDENGDIYRMIK